MTSRSWCGVLLICVLALALGPGGPAFAAGPRLALVIGNSGYTDPGVPALKNPAGDSDLIAARLRDAGFDVTHVVDGDLATLKNSVAAFGQELREAGRDGTGLFYYAGHAVQSFGINYILPVDTALEDPADLDLVALDASSILRQMNSARNATNIVVLDACRNNPFEAMAAFNTSGLAEMRAPTGTFLSYATAPGDVALDGSGDHSPFTAALAREMLEPGRSIEEVFRRVRINVLEATLGRQTPWDTSSLTREFSFVPGAATGLAAEAQQFTAAQAQGTVEGYANFLRSHPNSVFVEAARMERDALIAAQNPSESAELSFSPVHDEGPRGAGPSPADAAAAQLFESVRRSRDPVELALFLRAYPDSVFAAEARSLLAAVSLGAPEPAVVASRGASAGEPSPPQSAPPAATATPQLPTDEERSLLAAARASNTPDDYRRYLEAFPNGVFAELARLELAAAEAAAAPSGEETPAAGDGVETAALGGAPAADAAPEADAGSASIGFDVPLSAGGDGVRGRSIAELIEGHPLFAPIEGLPESYWKDQQCSNCHNWEQANLCTQAQTYLAISPEEAGAKRHPYGGTFKQGLRQWAEAGCP